MGSHQHISAEITNTQRSHRLFSNALIADGSNLRRKEQPSLGGAKTFGRDLFLQQEALRHDGIRKQAVGPLCVGDFSRDVLVRTYVPALNYVYEPVITIEISSEIAGKLSSNDGTCSI